MGPQNPPPHHYSGHPVFRLFVPLEPKSPQPRNLSPQLLPPLDLAVQASSSLLLKDSSIWAFILILLPPTTPESQLTCNLLRGQSAARARVRSRCRPSTEPSSSTSSSGVLGSASPRKSESTGGPGKMAQAEVCGLESAPCSLPRTMDYNSQQDSHSWPRFLRELCL